MLHPSESTKPNVNRSVLQSVTVQETMLVATIFGIILFSPLSTFLIDVVPESYD